MPLTFRVAVAVALVFTIFFVKNHLSSIDEQWQSDRSASRVPDFILDGAGTHIELVSGDDRAAAVGKSVAAEGTGARVASSSFAVSRVSSLTPSTSTTVGFLDPTGSPVEPARFEPQTIPVDVPNADYFDDPFLEEYLDSLDYGFGGESRHGHNQLPPKPESTPKPPVPKLTDRIVVLGRMSWEDSDWLEEELPEWPNAVYVIDDPESEYHVAENKGKESNVYLTWIIDNYDSLPEYMVFLHAHRFASHVELNEQDNALTVQRLQLDYVRKTGYVNLRCDWTPGCPDEVYPFRQLAGRTTEIAFAGAWIKIFNNTDIPEVIGTPCCAQFAVTKEQVLARPLSDYEHYYRWLMDTQLDDETSGRVFEYLWHIIFGQDPVSCPSKAQCYSDVYDMEYIEPVIPDWISDNPFRGVKNNHDFIDDSFEDGFDDEFDDGFDLPGDSLDENEDEGDWGWDEEEEGNEDEDIEEGDKEDEKEDPNDEDPFDFDDISEELDFDDSPVSPSKDSDPWEDTNVDNLPTGSYKHDT
ncbi:hypothetical protein N7466_001051 [Penicillium verhagenii]|uniref:uncharacterized protein n=1 Tax=Penicillium verhagenii TaxID=1562060 RepID=UPI002545AFCF|nr:uncharacterized protein N7466_001051 [Penicillium verhagenii]KAJ5948036.1 hypothetical protein N7466_001051 [Penicillium verhagenii]